MLRATRIRWPVWKNWQIRWFVRRYGVDMSEACATSQLAYPDFNAFFTRALKPELRPICEGLDCVACPADGTLSQAATVCDGSLLQVKGIHYSLATLLGGDDALAERSQKWADLEYVRILYLAATTMQCEVEAVLSVLLEAGEVPEYEAVKAKVRPAEPGACPEVHVQAPDLSVYDALLAHTGVEA